MDTSDRDELVDALALLLAKKRTGGHVYMGGEHNPLPSEQIAARMFVEDHINPLQAENERLRKAIDHHRNGFLDTLGMTDHVERELRRGELDKVLWSLLEGGR